MKKRILFVDDDSNLRDGLKRMLRSMRQEWDMVFASSASDALEMLKTEAIDVLVSDVRMPVMNGVELLNQVKAQYPQVIRFLLSGQSDEGLIMSSVGPTHQYLSKPCDPAVLKEAINRACGHGDLVEDKGLKALVTNIETLPSLPSMYTQLSEELSLPDPSIQRVGEIIAGDMAMTAQLLKLVNSAFFGLRRQVSNPIQAASLLGIETIKTLTLTLKLFEQLSSNLLTGFNVNDLWVHSLKVGNYAKTIILHSENGSAKGEEALAAGLLHDMGMLVLINNMPERYQEILDLTQSGESALWQAEREILGVTHGELAAYLLSLWGLDESIVEAVAYHHFPSDCQNNVPGVLTAVHVANVFSHATDSHFDKQSRSSLDESYLRRVGCFEQVVKWQDLCLAKELASEEA